MFVEVQLRVYDVPHSLALDQLWMLEKLKSENNWQCFTSEETDKRSIASLDTPS